MATETPQPVVSVVIPVYNVRHYVRTCLDSVTGQTFQRLEIILIDDGSTDGSGAICDEYAFRDPRINVLHTENRGLASARNLGLQCATGSYLSFIDSDDWIEYRAMETLVSAAIREEADLVAAWRITEFAGRSVPQRIMDENVRSFRGQEIIRAYSCGIFGDVVWNKLYRLDLFSGIHFPDGHNYEDVAVTPLLMKKLAARGGKAVLLPERLFHFRARKSSITHTGTCGNAMDCWAAFRGKLDLFPEDADRLLTGCFSAIGRMWASHSAFSPEEKAKAAAMVREMQAFSAAHFRRILRGRAALKTKLVCLVSQSRSPAVMLGCHVGARLCRGVRRLSRGLFP